MNMAIHASSRCGCVARALSPSRETFNGFVTPLRTATLIRRERPTRTGSYGRGAVMSAVRDADECGEEQELLRLQVILNDQAEKMERRREAERAETRLATATKAGAPDAAKGAEMPSAPAFWTAGPGTIGDDLADAGYLRLDPQNLNHRVTPLHRGPLRHTREVADSCWDRAWSNLHTSKAPNPQAL